MLKKITFYAILLMLFSFDLKENQKEGHKQIIQGLPFNLGETIVYTASLGDLILAEATVTLDKKMHKINARNCFKADSKIKTIGLVGFLGTINSSFTSYIDENIMPQKNKLNANEGKYIRNQETDFDYPTGTATVFDMDERNSKKYPFSFGTHDALSAFYSFRNIDFAALKENETKEINIFGEGKTSKLVLKFIGKRTIKTTFGNKETLLFQPIFPEKTTTNIEKDADKEIEKASVRMWVLADATHLPVKVVARGQKGTFKVELKSFRP